MGKSIGAAVIGAIVVLLIYHVLFVLKPLNAVKAKIGVMNELVFTRADTVRRDLGAMKTNVSELDQRVTDLETSRDIQGESITKINTALEDAKMAVMQVQEKADLAVKLGRSRVKSGTDVTRTRKTGSVKSKKTVPERSKKQPDTLAGSEAKSDTLLAKLLEGQNTLSQRVDDLNKRLDEQEAIEEPKTRKKDKMGTSPPFMQARSWKNSFAF